MDELARTLALIDQTADILDLAYQREGDRFVEASMRGDDRTTDDALDCIEILDIAIQRHKMGAF